MAPPGLPPHVGFGLVGGKPVFLDLERDRYFGLPPALQAAVTDGDLGRAEADLLRLGLLSEGPDSRPFAPACAHVPRPSLLDLRLGRPRLRIVLRATRSLIRIRRRLRMGLIADEVQAVASAWHAVRTTRAVQAGPIAAGFLAARRLVPIPPNCLADSLALAGFLACRGASAELVFGVKLQPFRAHAWVQTREMLLNDGFDGVGEYTPVLVVR